MFTCRIDAEVELRLLEERHAETLFTLVDANRERLREWMPWVDGTRAANNTRDFIKSALKQYAGNNGFASGIWYQGQLAGVVSYGFWDFEHYRTEIGYWLAEECTGRGIMTRAVRMLVDYALNTIGLNRVEIRCATGNVKSCAIPLRLGFTHEGVQRQGEWLYDHFVDLNLFSMLAEDWKAQQEGT